MPEIRRAERKSIQRAYLRAEPGPKTTSTTDLIKHPAQNPQRIAQYQVQRGAQPGIDYASDWIRHKHDAPATGVCQTAQGPLSVQNRVGLALDLSCRNLLIPR